jgi:hypothetical protein
VLPESVSFRPAAVSGCPLSDAVTLHSTGHGTLAHTRVNVVSGSWRAIAHLFGRTSRTVVLSSPVIVTNLYTTPLTCNLVGSDSARETALLQPGETMHVNTIVRDRSARVRFAAGASAVTEFIELPVDCSYAVPRRVQLDEARVLDVEFSMLGDATHVSVFASHWVVNHSGLDLVYDQMCVQLQHS